MRWQLKITNEGVMTRYTTPEASANFVGLVIFWEWAMSASQIFCYTMSWSLANVISVDQDQVTKAFVRKLDLKCLNNVDNDEWKRLTDDRNKCRSLITEMKATIYSLGDQIRRTTDNLFIFSIYYLYYLF